MSHFPEEDGYYDNHCGECHSEARIGLPLSICAACDEFLFCDLCSVPCDCGKGPYHRLCKRGDHFCRFECCPKFVCKNAEIPVYQGIADEWDDPSQWCGDSWCNDHRPPVSSQMVERVLDSLGITLEEVEALKGRKRTKNQ